MFDHRNESKQVLAAQAIVLLPKAEGECDNAAL
jgi:hypothetical protein